MKKTNRHILLGLMGASSLILVSCSSTSKNNDYATYPSSGYGNYGADSYGSTAGGNTSGGTAGGNTAGNTADQTYASSGGGGGAYPTTPQNYGTDYGSTGGGASTAPSTSGQTHTVQRGETLYRIGVNYGTTVSNIKAANGLTSDIIRPGDVLVVR